MREGIKVEIKRFFTEIKKKNNWKKSISLLKEIMKIKKKLSNRRKNQFKT